MVQITGEVCHVMMIMAPLVVVVVVAWDVQSLWLVVVVVVVVVVLILVVSRLMLACWRLVDEQPLSLGAIAEGGNARGTEYSVRRVNLHSLAMIYGR